MVTNIPRNEVPGYLGNFSPFLAHLVGFLVVSSSPFRPFLALLSSLLLALSEIESLHFEVW